jgi:hypothetical protein
VAEWYLYADSGLHRGPFSSEVVVEAVRTGKIGRETQIARAGDLRTWRPIADVAELADKLGAPPAKECYRIVEGAFTKTGRGTPEFGATMLIVGTQRPKPGA